MNDFIGASAFKNLDGIKVRHTYTLIHGLSVEFPAKYLDQVRHQITFYKMEGGARHFQGE